MLRSSVMCPISVGDGRFVSFWHDVWMGGSPFSVTFHRILALDIHINDTVRDRMDVGWLMESLRRPPRGGIEKIQWHTLLSLLQDFQLTLVTDRLEWLLDVLDTFFVSSVRAYLNGGVLFSVGSET